MDKSIEKAIDTMNSALGMDDFTQAAIIAQELITLPLDELGTTNFVQVSTIFGFSLIRLNKIDDAKMILQPLLDNNLGVVDAAFLLFSIAYTERATDDVIRYGKLFLDATQDDKNQPASITSAVQNAHELANNYATTLLNSERNEEAKEVLKKGIQLKNDYPFFYINLGIIYHKEGSFEDAQTILREGLNNCPEKDEIHRFIGIIYAENHFYIGAEIQFMKAKDAGNIEVLLDIALIYHKLYKIYDAEEYLLEYLKHFPQHQEALQVLDELRSYPFYGDPEPKISVAMIVKNEEHMLEECIQSFREAVDEIVIVDTGSDDRTVEIAKEFQVSLYHHEWKNDFSEARNYSISKVTGEWVLIIDADERLAHEDIPAIRSMKWQKDHDVICCAVYSTLPGQAGGANFGKHYSPRMFRKSPDIYYDGIVHNVLQIPAAMAVSEMKIYHLGYDLDREKMKNKFERSINLLLNQVKEQPDNPFVQMNTAQMFLSRNFVDKAEPYAQECVRLMEENPGNNEHLLLMGLFQLAVIYLNKDDYERCEEYCLKAIKKKENYIDPILILGLCYYLVGELDNSKEQLEKYLEYRKEHLDKGEFNLLILSKLGGDYEAHFLIGEIHKKRGEHDEAKESYFNSLKSNQLYWKAHNSLGNIYLEEKNYDAAVDAFENAIKYGYLNAEKYGTMGANVTEYKSAIENYKLAIENAINSQKAKPKVFDALAKVDEFLGL